MALKMRDVPFGKVRGHTSQDREHCSGDEGCLRMKGVE
jgi:hypothetical protein